MTQINYDVAVIGSGPAGESAAMNVAKHGKSVVIIENRDEVGGGCTHKGTIPSKALRHAVHQVLQFNNNPMFREISKPIWLTFEQALQSANKVITKQVEMRNRFYGRNRVDVIKGTARFQDKNKLVISGGEHHNNVIKADHIVIATGSSPYRPAGIDFTHSRVFDSDTILNLKLTPKRIIIFGAGVIGCEYASIFSGLGCKVDLVNPTSSLLAFMDDEISDALSYHLRGHGVLIRHDENFESCQASDDNVKVTLTSGKTITADVFMWANGRSGNTAKLGLEKLDIKVNSRGQIEVDDNYQTSVEGISAAGDVIGWPSLASAAYDQGRSSVARFCGEEEYQVNQVPTGIYTIPEISSIGMTETELTKAKIPYEIGKAYFKDTGRAQITGETVGVLKLLFHSQTMELLGIHCFGDQAAEILHIGQAIMAQDGEANSIKYFLSHTFNYPTMAEAYRVAAINGLNRLAGD
ncbi:Si-specific NAD(P)(+) transhydrogenase [Marinicellulosiphila megalodicopiae]|uniref:Si-specific NAD(P)(+) transhydrogenase n=1 Tax=Marinicellulosiphila megalodicopiae TaxID=2724896 RepID=UPI003BAEB12E